MICHFNGYTGRNAFLKSTRYLSLCFSSKFIGVGSYRSRFFVRAFSVKNELVTGVVRKMYKSSSVIQTSDFVHVIVPNINLNGAFIKDKVVVLSEPQKTAVNNNRVVHILERKLKYAVGVVKYVPKPVLVCAGTNVFIDIKILDDYEYPQLLGEKVVLKVDRDKNHMGVVVGNVHTVLGKVGDPEVENNGFIYEFGLVDEFPDTVLNEVEALEESTSNYSENRKDLRHLTTFTIDPLTAKDFDDALSIEALPNGNTIVGVHIADVSHYVAPGTELDKSAQSRCFSIYMPGKTIPMLPEKLSNDLCSLRPNEDRFSFSAIFEFSRDLQVVSEWYGETVIHSDKRFVYEEAQEILDKGEGPFYGELSALDSIAKSLRAERLRNGALEIRSIEPRVDLDDLGMPTGISTSKPVGTNSLIEEFMLLANRRVAEHLSSYGNEEVNYPYRTHSKPLEALVEQFDKISSKFGHNFSVDMPLVDKFRDIVEKWDGTLTGDNLSLLALQTMSKAVYVPEARSHFALQFDRYTHFTSPIRRYIDIIVHRAMKNLVMNFPADRNLNLSECIEIVNEREMDYVEVYRASIKLKQVQFLAAQDDRIKTGFVSYITPAILGVFLPEGMTDTAVSLFLENRRYEYNRALKAVVDTQTKIEFSVGDFVAVELINFDLNRRVSDAKLIGHQELPKKG